MKKNNEYISFGIAGFLFLLISIFVFTKLEFINSSFWLSASFFLTAVAMMILIVSSAGPLSFESYKAREMDKLCKTLFGFFWVLAYLSVFSYIGDTNDVLSIFYPILQAIASFILSIFLIAVVCLIEIKIRKILMFPTIKLPKHIL